MSGNGDVRAQDTGDQRLETRDQKLETRRNVRTRSEPVQNRNHQNRTLRSRCYVCLICPVSSL